MAHVEVGLDVIRQAADNSLENTEPLAWRGGVGTAVSLVLMVAVYQGWFTQEESVAFGLAIDKFIVGLVTLLPFLIALWARLKTWSGRSAAKIAVANAALPVGSAPVLKSPP